ncbi:hypothetical protein M0R45_031904 [Rubus argutus]|uniref:Uncharacterized protein n=1 Tax=Rubus argutus TaxID=59490 RepID=A0AAW1WG04_RUBAR
MEKMERIEGNGLNRGVPPSLQRRHNCSPLFHQSWCHHFNSAPAATNTQSSIALCTYSAQSWLQLTSSPTHSLAIQSQP